MFNPLVLAVDVSLQRPLVNGDEITELAEGLDDPAAGARIMAVIELANSADPGAIPYLAKAIRDEQVG